MSELALSSPRKLFHRVGRRGVHSIRTKLNPRSDGSVAQSPICKGAQSWLSIAWHTMPL